MITIFGEKIGVFLINKCYDQNIAYFSFVLSQKRQFFAEFFGKNIFKIITSVPGGSELHIWAIFHENLMFTNLCPFYKTVLR
jgi:hypothetical protein